MSTMTFQINDASTSSGGPAVWVTITENANGTLTFSVTQSSGVIGDLRGVFFDVSDESILSTLRVLAQSDDIRIGNDNIVDLGGGATMSGLTGTDKGYDVGIEIGTSGIGKDDIRSFEFTLSSTARALTLDDFSGVDFGARLTSVGMINGTRGDSSKLLENTSDAIDMNSTTAALNEDATTGENIFTNSDAGSGSTSTVTGWSGGAVGSTVALMDGENLLGYVTLNSDGSYTVDASLADRLSEGEQITFETTVDVRNQTEATSWSTDTTTLKIVLTGVNDGPVANDDNGGSMAENATLTGSVVTNDSDVDHLDTHTWSIVEGSLKDANGNLMGGTLTMDADGNWSYNANGTLDYLMQGESVQLHFEYLMSDGMASDSAFVNFTVTGVGSPPPPPPVDPVDPSIDVLYNHGTNQTDHGWFPQASDGQDKTNVYDGFTENDTLKIAGYGDADDMTLYAGDFGLGDPDELDTLFVIGIDGNRNSTRTEDWGYLEDYSGLTQDQILVTGGNNIDYVEGTYTETLVQTYDPYLIG